MQIEWVEANTQKKGPQFRFEGRLLKLPPATSSAAEFARCLSSPLLLKTRQH